MEDRLKKLFQAFSEYQDICLDRGVDSGEAVAFRAQHLHEPTFVHLMEKLHDKLRKQSSNSYPQQHPN